MKECEYAECVISDKREGRAKMGMPYASIAEQKLNGESCVRRTMCVAWTTFGVKRTPIYAFS